MQNGSVHIDEDDVRDLLDTLITPTNDLKPANPLLSLAVVDDYLLEAVNLRMRYPRVYALQAVVAEIITDQLIHHRHSLHLYFSAEETQEEAEDSIQRDHDTGSLELTGWSLLYYCYVQVNLNLTLKHVSNLLHLVPRTLRRYRQHAVRRLTEVLVYTERETRFRHRVRRLRGQFPPLPNIRIIGRYEEIERLQHYYDQHRRGIILVTGMRGIGKTTLLQHFINVQIERDERIDHVIWVTRPQSIDTVRHALDEVVSTISGTFQLLCESFNVIVVIDDADSLIENFQSLRTLSGNCLLMISSSIQSPIHNVDLKVTLSELDMVDTRALIHSIYAQSPELENLLSPAYLQPIREVAGGNPMAIRLVSQQFVIGNFALSKVDLFAGFIQQLYDRISPQAKRLWHALAISNSGDLNIDGLLMLWRDSFGEDAVNELITCHLLTCTALHSRKYTFADSAAHFIRQRYLSHSSENIHILDMLLGELDSRLQEPYALETVDHILKQEWLEISFDRQRSWIKGLLHGEKKTIIWQRVLRKTYQETLDPENALLNLEFCRMLKVTGQWDVAETGLQFVLKQTGSKSAFDIQVLAMIEYSALLERRGAYQQALALLDRAYVTADRNKWAELAYSILLEQAQNAIDRRAPDIALEKLNAVPFSLRRLLLEAEALLLRGDYDTVYHQCHIGLEIAGNDRTALAHLHTLLGRTDEARGNFSESVQHFSAAANYYNHRDDLFHLARCWSNLGAVIMRLGRKTEAKQHLVKAQRVQEALGDRLGLAVTQYNLSLTRQSY